MIKKIGIIGGTFNPIHNAHLLIAEQFFDDLGLDKCYFVPSFISPFKLKNNENNNNNDEALISADDRLEMVKLALGKNPHFLIDTYELDKKGVSYSIETISYFKNKFPDAELYFLIGQDQASNFTKWKNWKEIIDLCQLTIAKRVDDSQFPSKHREKISTELNVNNKNPLWISNTNMEISSSDIRKRIENSLSTNYLLPDSVYDYIKNNNLYK